MMRRLFLCLLLICAGASAEELLHPAIAFKPTARALDGQTIEGASRSPRGTTCMRASSASPRCRTRYN